MYRLFAGRLTKMVLTIPRPDQQQSRSATMPISNNADQQQCRSATKLRIREMRHDAWQELASGSTLLTAH
jgi:hypothetical protein